MSALIYSEAFRPRRQDPCFCGSGRRFKSCCGSLAADRPPPFGLRLYPGWLDAERCAELVAYAATRPKGWLGVVEQGDDARESRRVQGRVTDAVIMGERQAELDDLVRRIVREVIEPAEGPVAWVVRPQLLVYGPGGRYGPHADSDNPVPGTNRFQRMNDRHVSILLYLADDFTGGELYFRNFNYRYRPCLGDLVLFPSDQRYIHEAEPVTSGTRYALVSWATKAEEPRILPAPPPDALFMQAPEA